jgi:hypothetical protein
LISTDVLKVTALPKIQIALPNPATDGRICFYGYDIETKWLIDYAITHWCWGPIDSGYDNLSKISGGLKLLSFHTGIKDLEWESALKDHTTPSNVVTRTSGEARVPIVSIFSDEGPSFKRRPGRPIVGNSGQAAKVVG